MEEAVNSTGPTIVRTDKNKEIPADYVIPATGLKVHSGAYANAFSKYCFSLIIMKIIEHLNIIS